MNKSLFLIVFLMLLSVNIQLVSGAHFIIGFVNDALDGTSANGQEVIMWNPANGVSDNLTDIIGPGGNSGTDNIYMMDCELLSTPCVIDDEIRVEVLNNGSGYIAGFVNLSVTGAGYDVMENLSLNSPPAINEINVNDDFIVPVGEIDLIPASAKEVICEGVIYEYDGNETLVNASAEFFDSSASFYGDIDDNNLHYTNNSCEINLGYGNNNESYFNCSFQVEYYANSGNWNCSVKAYDNMSVAGQKNNGTNINTLLALSVSSPVDFGIINASAVGNEFEINVTNAGNLMMNLSLSSYAVNEGDGFAMNCSSGNKNISVDYEKYNLTASNSGPLTLTEFESLYTNTSSNPDIRKFNLDYRKNDVVNDAFNSTYWRIYVPLGVAGTCSGNIVFGAVQAGEV